MRSLLALVVFLSSMNALAVDQKIGNVIAVERTITNLYNRCLEKVDGPKDTPKPFFACGFRYTQHGEQAITQGRVLKLTDERCEVVGEVFNGALLITFAGSGSSSTFEVAKSCLEKALQPTNYVRTIIYTIQ